MVAFEALLDGRHVGRAAKRFGLSQPAFDGANFADPLFIRTVKACSLPLALSSLAAPSGQPYACFVRRLKLRAVFAPSTSDYGRTYSYDAFGNLSVQTNSSVPLSGVAPVNNGSNPYTATTNHLVTVDGAGGYDPRGNMTKLGAVTMGYDAESNMTSTVDSGTGQNISWVYDAGSGPSSRLPAERGRCIFTIRLGSWRRFTTILA